MASEADESKGDQDVAARAAGLVEAVVSAIRDHSVRPANTIVRAIVVGVIVGLVGLVVLVLLFVGLFRLLDTDAFAHRAWLTDLVGGGIFLGLGALSFSMAARRKSDDRD